MKFINNLSATKAFLIPLFGLLIWGAFLFILFNLPSSIVNAYSQQIDIISYILFSIYVFLNVSLFIVILLKKKIKSGVALALGFVITVILFYSELILFFVIGIAGGAAG